MIYIKAAAKSSKTTNILAYPGEGVCSRAASRLLEIVHEIQVGKRAPVFVHVVISVGSNKNGADIGNSRYIRWHQLLDHLFAASSQLQFIHRGRTLAQPVNKQRSPIAAPRDRSLTNSESSNRTNLSAFDH